MTEAMFQRLLDRAGAASAKRGPAKLPDEKTATLYLAHQGASITVAHVCELSLSEGIVEAKNKKGELFLMALDSVFAASISGDGEKSGGRRAGFMG